MIGTRLGSWMLQRELGRGGMGCVYLGRRVADGSSGPEQAAIKVLAAHLAFDAGQLTRFQREIEVLRQLDHPGIVRLLEAGEEAGRHYYAMELVEGESLEVLVQQRARLPWQEVLDAALQVCLALKHAHDRGVFHRDLKPSNLLRGEAVFQEGVGRFGTIKLTDFGIAWVFAGEHLTATGSYVGTPEYVSPEQASGKQPTRRSDLYSLGVVLYRLVTGRLPFEGEPVDLLHKHRYGQFDRPQRLVADLPHDLDEVICELLEKDPEKRPADASVLYRRLDSLRRKYERRAMQNTEGGNYRQDTEPDTGEEPQPRTGPATLMARLMREELESQNRGGLIKQFFNHPLVLVTGLLICVGILVYTFMPDSADRLFERGTALAQSRDPDDWSQAAEWLDRLRERYPDFRQQEVTDLLHDIESKLASESARKEEVRNARLAGPMSEAHWFYEQGLRLRQQGQRDQAEALWRQLVQGFGEVETERPWVERAKRELETPSNRERTGENRWVSVRQALEQARRYEAAGNAQAAEKLRSALRELYREDPSAGRILDGKD